MADKDEKLLFVLPMSIEPAPSLDFWTFDAAQNNGFWPRITRRRPVIDNPNDLQGALSLPVARAQCRPHSYLFLLSPLLEKG
jgi:hypothetical protein